MYRGISCNMDSFHCIFVLKSFHQFQHTIPKHPLQVKFYEYECCLCKLRYAGRRYVDNTQGHPQAVP